MSGALYQKWFGDDFEVRRAAGSAPAIQNFTLDASTDALEFLCLAPEAATITRLGIRFGANAGTTPTYRISARGVDTTVAPNIPSATLLGATANAKNTFSPTALGWAAGSWNWLTLDESFDVTRGQYFSIVVDYYAGTIDAANMASFSYAAMASGGGNHVLPRAITNAAGVRTHQSAIGLPIYGFGSSAKAYGRPLSGIGQAAGLTNVSNPYEVGHRWTTPAGWGATYKVAGIELYVLGGTSATDVTLRLYDGSGAADVTALQSLAISHGALLNSRQSTQMLFSEASLATLNYGSGYRGTIFNGGSTSNMYLHYFDVASNDDLDAYPGGKEVYWTQRASGGNWADTNTRRLLQMQLLVNDITEPAGGGGLLVHPGMRGGCNG